MTTFQETAPPLRRLFERLDWAPQPRRAPLADILATWREARAGRLHPTLAEFTGDRLPPGAFVFRRDAAADDYALVAGADALSPLSEGSHAGDPLSGLDDRRIAVRLRRLFDAVREAGEPVLGAFARERHGEEIGRAEILALPLAGDDPHAVAGVLAAVDARPVAALHPAHRAGAPAEGPALFALASDGIGHRIADALGLDPAPHEERRFEDGEHKARPLVSVRGRDVVVVDSLAAGDGLSPNDRLCRLLFFVGALKDAAARRVTAVVPYLAYARKDRQTKPRDPVTSRYVAALLEAVGTDRVVVMEVHNPSAFQNAFRIDTDLLDADALFVRHFAPAIGDGPAVVVSPDLGGGKRADRFREALEAALGRPVGKAFLEKSRSMGVVSGELFAGDVEGAMAIVIDDLVATGGTMARAARACVERGAKRVAVAATHGLFTAGAEPLWRESAIAEVVVTDTVDPAPLDPALVGDRLVVLPAAEVFADLLRRDLGLARPPGG